MTSLRPTRKPAFLWQAGLILLPVVIIAAVALTAIIQNRTEVEREARLRAEEVARQYGKELERRLGYFLVAQHDVNSMMWEGHLTEVTGGWPGSKQRAQAETRWHLPPDPPYPGWRAEEVFPDRFGLTAEGRLLVEFNPAPQPPAWFLSLSPAQREAWEALKSASSGTNIAEVERRIVAFGETGPDWAARLNATFLGLRARLGTLSPAEAVSEALRFIEQGTMLAYREGGTGGELHDPPEYWETLSEAGLPLMNLAFGEAVRYARVTGPSERLWYGIPGQVLHAPSPLVPALLDQLQEIAGTNSALQAGVRAWRRLWNARLKLCDFAEAVRQTGKLRGITTTNFWIEHDQTRWLCTLNPEPHWMPNPADGVMVRPTNVCTGVRFVPKSVVEQALARALETSEVKLPDYLGLAAWLEGEPLNLPERWRPASGAHSATPMFAEATGALTSTGTLHDAPGRPDIDYEMLPSRPRFVLQLYVADQALLFSSYRRHAWLLAGLVAASAFAALIGVFASWLAFQRQLRLNELKSNFVSSVSHELRSPIASVRLMAESLERGRVSEALKQHEYFRFIVQECRRLSSLIENVLDFSRIEQGRKQYDFEPTDLVALTQQTVKLMETYAAEREVKLNLQLPDPQPSTLNPQPSADGKALQQALVNLIDNALKHSPKGGSVTVGLEVGTQNAVSSIQQHSTRNTQHATRLRLWVEDHGVGIPAAEQEKIFERFYRPGSELRRQTQGVGIGLSIVKHIVEAHGGRVLVRSAPGQGSRFTIELPMSEAAAKPETRNPKTE
jgi:signal transduction histidine kinase